MEHLMDDVPTSLGNKRRFPLLPIELLRLICTIGVLHRSDLRALRLVHRNFEATIASFLFEDLPMSSSKACHSAFFNVCATPRLAQHVKRVIWYELCADFRRYTDEALGIVEGPDADMSSWQDLEDEEDWWRFGNNNRRVLASSALLIRALPTLKILGLAAPLHLHGPCDRGP